MLDAVTLKRIDQCVDDGRRSADGTRFPGPFHAQRVGGRRNHIIGEIDVRGVVRARHRVIHEGRAQQLTGFGIVLRLLKQCLAQALHDPAVNLTFQK